jgi:hypothetical protein
MAEGNEGDSIVFLALRQIECDIPDSVTTFGAISPDLLVEIVDKCLNLISNGSIKVISFIYCHFDLLYQQMCVFL